MITVEYPDEPTTLVSEPIEDTCLIAESIAAYDDIRRAEIASIRCFVESQKHYLRGRVLDYGAGKPGTCREPQPYRYLMAPDAEYIPYDLGDDWHAIYQECDVILCTQVLQFIADPRELIQTFAGLLHSRQGHLIMTYPTNWDECEPGDLWRFTQAGVDRLLRDTGFEVIEHERRAEVRLGVFRFALGYGVVARAGNGG